MYYSRFRRGRFRVIFQARKSASMLSGVPAGVAPGREDKWVSASSQQFVVVRLHPPPCRFFKRPRSMLPKRHPAGNHRRTPPCRCVAKCSPMAPATAIEPTGVPTRRNYENDHEMIVRTAATIARIYPDENSSQCAGDDPAAGSAMTSLDSRT